MIFVVISSGFELLLPIALIIGAAAGIASGALGAWLAEWFHSWAFTPSFFLAVLPIFVILVLAFYEFFDWISEKLPGCYRLYNFFTEKGVNIFFVLVAIFSGLCVINAIIQPLFFLMSQLTCNYDWLWDNLSRHGPQQVVFFYSWLHSWWG